MPRAILPTQPIQTATDTPYEPRRAVGAHRLLTGQHRPAVMPTAALRPCTGSPTCPHFAGQCPTHAKRTDRHVQGSAQARGYDHAWATFSKRQLQQFPVCGQRHIDGRLDPTYSRCLQAGRTTPAQCVDHIVPMSKGGKQYDLANLGSLCIACNSAKGNR